jgi:hypothetical protein
MNAPRSLPKNPCAAIWRHVCRIECRQKCEKPNEINSVPDVWGFGATFFMRVRACAKANFGPFFNRLMDTPPRHTGTSGTPLFLFRKNEKSGGTWKGTQP